MASDECVKDSIRYSQILFSTLSLPEKRSNLTTGKDFNFAQRSPKLNHVANIRRENGVV